MGRHRDNHSHAANEADALLEGIAAGLDIALATFDKRGTMGDDIYRRQLRAVLNERRPAPRPTYDIHDNIIISPCCDQLPELIKQLVNARSSAKIDPK